jgi:DNA-directed RNA polymerase specialized sigma24 family protein
MDAFEVLVRRTNWRSAGWRNGRSDAEEAAQDAFLQAWQAVSGWTPRRST